MSVQLNHTIVHAKDKRASAEFLAGILGLGPPKPFSHLLTVQLDNEVTLDYMDADPGFDIQHFAFLVGEPEFDEIFGRIREQGLSFWADPMHRVPNSINTSDGGRGVYFSDPSGHNMEIITKPYGGGS